MRRSNSLPNLHSYAYATRQATGGLATSLAIRPKEGSDARAVHGEVACQALACIDAYRKGLLSEQHALRQALKPGVDEELDLSRCSAQDVLSIPDDVMQAYVEVARSLNRPLLFLRLPDPFDPSEQLMSQPTWLGCCKDLTCIDVGFYGGEALDLRGCPNLQSVSGSAGRALQQVFVAANVDCEILPYRHNDGFWRVRDNGETTKGVKVHAAEREPSMAYMTNNPGVESCKELDLNGQAVFRPDTKATDERIHPGRTKIDCTYLSAFWMGRRMAHLAKHEGAHRWNGAAPHEPFDYTPLTSVSELEAHSDEIAACYFKLFQCGVVARHGVVQEKAGELFSALFHGMERQNRSFMHCFLVNDIHCMPLEIRRDVAPDGKVRYRASFYDPSLTAQHLSQWTTNAEELATWALQNFFTDSPRVGGLFGMGEGDELMTVCEVAQTFSDGWWLNWNSMLMAPYEYWVPNGKKLHARSTVQLLGQARWNEWGQAMRAWWQAEQDRLGEAPTKQAVLGYLTEANQMNQKTQVGSLGQYPEARQVHMKLLLDCGFDLPEVHALMCKLLARLPLDADLNDPKHADQLKEMLPESLRSKVLLELLDLAMPRPPKG